MSLSDIASVFRTSGATGFAIIVLAFVTVTLLSSLIALVKWVLANMVPLSVHTTTQDNICDELAEIHSDTRLLVDRGAK